MHLFYQNLEDEMILIFIRIDIFIIQLGITLVDFNFNPPMIVKSILFVVLAIVASLFYLFLPSYVSEVSC